MSFTLSICLHVSSPSPVLAPIRTQGHRHRCNECEWHGHLWQRHAVIGHFKCTTSCFYSGPTFLFHGHFSASHRNSGIPFIVNFACHLLLSHAKNEWGEISLTLLFHPPNVFACSCFHFDRPHKCEAEWKFWCSLKKTTDDVSDSLSRKDLTTYSSISWLPLTQSLGEVKD